ncbi:MAG: sugar transferase, partial [Anaerolineae bacterium]
LGLVDAGVRDPHQEPGLGGVEISQGHARSAAELTSQTAAEARVAVPARLGARGSSGNGASQPLAVLGDLASIEALVARHGAGEVVVATSAVSRADLVDLFRRFARRSDVQLRLSSGLFEVMTTGLEVKELAYVPLINVQPVRLTGIDVALKLLLDYGVATLAVVLGSPLFAALALAVRLDSPGPILHRRRVLGLGGKEFDAYKFRTMHENAVELLEEYLAAHPELRAEFEEHEKLRADPRVTRVGRVLRKCSLDELPQLFNVLLGQMSIVGPRMITKAEHPRYRQWDMNLLTVKPGITGLWQVSGRSDVSYEERVQLDMNYIRNWTIWLDLHILLRTIPAVLRGRGAY